SSTRAHVTTALGGCISGLVTSLEHGRTTESEVRSIPVEAVEEPDRTGYSIPLSRSPSVSNWFDAQETSIRQLHYVMLATRDRKEFEHKRDTLVDP
ncbi:MAG: hypothetical protein M1121_05545, partial [Actinobacteria bacterium]|nr:hypothetical protein [Actinomycetota bacterium]